MYKYEVMTILDFAEEYIKAVIRNEASSDVEDAINVSLKKEALIDYICEVFKVTES